MSDILVVDDNENYLKVIALRLESEGYGVKTAATSGEAIQSIREKPFDLTLLDLKLKETDGLSLMEELHAIRPEMPIIILTGHGSIESAVEAMQKGAQGYLTKPFDYREMLLQIEKCLEKRSLIEEVSRLKDLVKERYGFDNIVDKSKKMEKVLEQISLAADSDSVVHIEGESGTGKELIARTLHVASPRRSGPFVAVNCAAIPETLLESELFGYQMGAFTGAVKSNKGFFLRANGGSLFLDEISEMPLSMQPKLLRVLEDKRIYPLGGGEAIKVDTHIITASNKNLREEVSKGNFREDLFYRIHVIPIVLPPLRERRESIPFLARHFLIQYARKMKKNVKRFSPGAMHKLMGHDWPGNVRELKNSIEYAVAMSTGNVITEDLFLHVGSAEDQSPPSFKNAKEQFERQYLSDLISRAHGNVSVAAKMAAKHRPDLYELFRKYGINPADFRQTGSGKADDA